MTKSIEFNQAEISYLLDCVSLKASASRIPFETLGNPEELAKIKQQFDIYSAVCTKLKSAMDKPGDDLILLWDKVLAVLEKEDSSPIIFGALLKPTTPITIKENQLEICVPSGFVKDLIEDRYMDRIKQIVNDITQTNMDITLVVCEQS